MFVLSKRAGMNVDGGIVRIVQGDLEEILGCVPEMKGTKEVIVRTCLPVVLV